MVRSSEIRAQHDDPDSLEEQILRLATEGKIEAAAAVAIRRQQAKGLPITFLRGDAIIKQYPDGREEVLGILARRPHWTPRHTLATNNG